MIGKYLGHAAALSKQAVELDNPSSQRSVRADA